LTTGDEGNKVRSSSLRSGPREGYGLTLDHCRLVVSPGHHLVLWTERKGGVERTGELTVKAALATAAKAAATDSLVENCILIIGWWVYVLSVVVVGI
jgi:hypothetical protein